VDSTDWQVVRDTMVDGMTNFGVPVIQVIDGDYQRRGELYLMHAHDGKDLETDYAGKTLRAIYKLWGRPVHLETKVDGVATRLSFDGKEGREEPVQ